MDSKGLLVGRFTYWEDARLQENRHLRPSEFEARSSVEARPNEILLRTFAFLYQPEVRVITRMSVLGPMYDGHDAEVDRPDVYVAMAGTEAEKNFVGARAVGAELLVDVEMGWGLLGIMDMLEPERIHPWLAAGTGDDVRRRVPPEIVQQGLSVGAAMFVSIATSYEAVLDPESGTLRSWTAFVDSSPALRLTLSVRNFLDVFPSP